MKKGQKYAYVIFEWSLRDLRSSQLENGTLPRIINGIVVFAKVQGLVKSETLRLYMSEDLCKNYYSHLYFTVVTFLTKIQNWCYITKKNTTIKKFGW